MSWKKGYERLLLMNLVMQYTAMMNVRLTTRETLSMKNRNRARDHQNLLSEKGKRNWLNRCLIRRRWRRIERGLTDCGARMPSSATADYALGVEMKRTSSVASSS
jgi:hypothetical protein